MSLLKTINGNGIVRKVKNFPTKSVPFTVAKKIKFQKQGKKLAKSESSSEDIVTKFKNKNVKYGHLWGFLNVYLVGRFLEAAFDR